MQKLLKLIMVSVLALTILTVGSVAAQDDDVVTVIVGTDAAYPPFESIDENGDFVGFDIELMDAIAADAGFEVEYVNTTFDGIVSALAQGEFDVVISAMTITEEREETINFSDPYFNAGQSIAVTSDLADSVLSEEDLAGLRVGVQLGTTGDAFASGLDGVEVVRFDDIILAFQALGEGDVDAIVNDFPVSADIIANNPDLNAVVAVTGLTEENYGIAVNPELTDVLDQINTSLANIIADGSYAEIHLEWFGQEAPAAYLPMGDDMAEGDMHGDMMEADRSTPEGAALATIASFFEAANADPVSPEMLLEFACEGAGDSPLLPDAATLEGFAGVQADLSGMSLTATEGEDGSVEVTFTEEAVVTLVIGDSEQELPASVLADQLGITSIRFVEGEDGSWLLCPAEETEE